MNHRGSHLLVQDRNTEILLYRQDTAVKVKFLCPYCPLAHLRLASWLQHQSSSPQQSQHLSTEKPHPSALLGVQTLPSSQLTPKVLDILRPRGQQQQHIRDQRTAQQHLLVSWWYGSTEICGFHRVTSKKQAPYTSISYLLLKSDGPITPSFIT